MMYAIVFFVMIFRIFGCLFITLSSEQGVPKLPRFAILFTYFLESACAQFSECWPTVVVITAVLISGQFIECFTNCPGMFWI